MTSPRPRIWVSRPLFDDVIAEALAPHVEIVQSAPAADYSPAELAAHLPMPMPPSSG
jgi:gluconate 2-dehydrogenase